MSDQPDSGRQAELGPEQEATVRRLLAEARHEEPIPVEVGDRLDRVLADLSTTSSDRAAPVIDLAARRRRRNAGVLLVAAAAVIVGGFAVGQVIDVGRPDDAGSASDNSVARDQTSGDSEGGAASSPVAPGPELSAEAPLKLTSKHLQSDVERQLARRSPVAEDAAPAPTAPTYGIAVSCASGPPRAYGAGKFYAAFYDGMPTVLALRPAQGGLQEAQVLDCSTGVPLRSVTVPAP